MAKGFTFVIGGDNSQFVASIADTKRRLDAVAKNPATVKLDIDQRQLERNVGNAVKAMQGSLAGREMKAAVGQQLIGAGFRVEDLPPAIRKAISAGAAPQGWGGTVRAAVAAGVVHYGAQAATGIAGAGRGLGMAGSADPLTAIEGQVKVIQSLEKIPVVGAIAGFVDQVAGLTESLQLQRQIIVGQQQARIGLAQATGNNRMAAGISANLQFDEAMRTRNAAAYNASVKDTFGLDSKADWRAFREAGQTMEILNQANAKNDRIMAARENAERSGYAWAGMSALMTRQRKGLSGSYLEERNAIIEGVKGVPDHMAAQAKFAAKERVETLDWQYKQSVGWGNYAYAGQALQARAVAANKGQAGEFATAIGRIAQLQQQISTAPGEFKGKALTEAQWQARAAYEGLRVRGGGVVAGETNLATDVIGDPLGIMRQMRQRGAARQAWEQSGLLGGQENGQLDTTNQLLAQLVQLVQTGAALGN